jgi:hypothetical protein
MKKLRFSAIAAVLVVAAWTMPAGAQEKASSPPCTSHEFSQFDFWIGAWRVTDEEGAYQGTNRIEKILDGCALQENWTGAGGMTGRSFNIYSKGRGSWHQTWVDSTGTLLLLDGGIENGRMVLRGEGPGRDGGAVEHEISWQSLEDGRVRQVWRVSSDGASTWKQVFVGLYNRDDQ